MMVGLRNSWLLISAYDLDSVLCSVNVQNSAIISNHQILGKLFVSRTEEERLTDVHLGLFLGFGEKVGNPSGEDSVAARNVKMAYHGGIATSECSYQFTNDRFGICLNTTQQLVLIYR